VVKNASTKQSKLDALELLARQRRGEKVDIGITEEEPLFEEVDEEEYQKNRKGGFVVDASDEEYDSEDDDFIDDGDDVEDDKKDRGKRAKGKRQSKTIEADPKQKSVASFFGAGTSGTSKASSSHFDTKKDRPPVDMDDMLSEMLFQDVKTPSRVARSKTSLSQTPSKTPSKTPSQTPSKPSPIVRSEPPTPKPDNNKRPSETMEVDEQVDNSAKRLKSDEIGPQSYERIYWYDCSEGSQGTVYFFGRINQDGKYVSCCLVVKNVRRTVYLSIAPNCTYDEAVSEFTHITAKKYGIKSFDCEKVTKKYAFSSDPNMPLLSDFVKVDYPATHAALPADLAGETFKKVLNISQSPMEKLILELKLRGPCWLRLIDPVPATSPLTWTKVELEVESPDNVIVESDKADLKPPYFCVLSLSLQTLAHLTIAGRNDILAISVMYNNTIMLDDCLKRSNKASGHFVLLSKPNKVLLPYDFNTKIKTFRRTKLELFDSERDLLTSFMEKYSELDPDIVVGHDLLNFDFETLVRQMVANKMGTWSKLGRFKRSTLVSTKKAFPYLFSGRALCDIKKMAEELMQLRSYDLTELCSQLLDRKRIEYDQTALLESFKSSDNLMNMLNASWEDVDSIFSILVELNIIPLALKITNITGNILSRTFAAGRSERNEYLLLHAFHEDNFICPEKRQTDQSNNLGRRKAAYTGGLVLEPKAGFYESCVLLMDFNSLYPSIIQEFNICFSTVKVPENEVEGSALVPNESVATGVLPSQLKNLVDRRRQVKRLMGDCKQPMQKTLLDIEQRALKLTANSMYGCLGFEYSRFYAKHLASLVTLKGREILMSTKALVESLGYEVIYGDTDSLMIDTKSSDYDHVVERGTEMKSSINRTFKLLEIDIDGVYRPLLLLKKKNYAGASVSKTADGKLVKKIETKGLDSVRRDRAVVAREAGEKILSMIMESDREVCQIVECIHAYLKGLAESIGKNELPVEKYLISKQLNKNPQEYRDTKGIGHVAIALRYNKDPRRAKKLRAGDVIEYVICTDNTSESANQRCYTLEELASDENLKLDLDYYLCQQIYPAVSRICDKLPLTNAYAIAEALGIESNPGVKIARDPAQIGSKMDQLISKGSARFNSCQPLSITCPDCFNEDQIDQRLRRNPKSNKLEPSLASCKFCGSRLASKSRHIVVQMILSIRRLVQRLYSGKFSCSLCQVSTRNLFGPLDEKERPLCVSCGNSMECDIDDRLLDLQLNYYKYLLDIEQERGQLTMADDTVDMYQRCREEILGALRQSYINTVDAQQVFAMVCSSGAADCV